MIVKFINRSQDKFFFTLRTRVEDYFKENNLSKFGDYRIWIKAIVMIGIYITSYVLILTSGLSLGWLWLFSAIMGLTMAGTGLTVMHDACHGTFSKNNKVNEIFGYTLNFLGGHAMNWKIQHNFLHHTYTNIEGLDADITTFPMLRFSPFAKRRAVHRYQHIYAWFFYGLMTVSWVLMKDFKQLVDYHFSGMTKSYSKGFGVVIARVLLLKAVYFSLTLVLPIILLPVAWYVTVAGFFLMHFIGGVILGMVFQAAHIMEVCDYPLPDANGKMADSWIVHQLRTTTNFAPHNQVLNWYVGGLNYQVEHHLFPRICHVHYPNIAPIVQSTCREYGIPYQSIPTFVGAVLGHGSMLRALGRKEQMAVA